MKVTAYFRDVVRAKHPGIEEAWILRVMAKPLEECRQPDGRYALWGRPRPFGWCKSGGPTALIRE
jgi:hypothetical protein